MSAQELGDDVAAIFGNYATRSASFVVPDCDGMLMCDADDTELQRPVHVGAADFEFQTSQQPAQGNDSRVGSSAFDLSPQSCMVLLRLRSAAAASMLVPPQRLLRAEFWSLGQTPQDASCSNES
jgi:hypothetical protein